MEVRFLAVHCAKKIKKNHTPHLIAGIILGRVSVAGNRQLIATYPLPAVNYK